jgi:GT2 family glycosyltransferase
LTRVRVSQVVRYALANGYAHLFIVNNDVLVADGSVRE